MQPNRNNSPPDRDAATAPEGSRPPVSAGPVSAATRPNRLEQVGHGTEKVGPPRGAARKERRRPLPKHHRPTRPDPTRPDPALPGGTRAEAG